MTRLEVYVAGCVLQAVALSAAALVALFSLLEFVDQLGAVGEGRYNLVDALIYVLLTIPSRLLQIAPVAMLLGSLLGLGLLGRKSELIVMQSIGLSVARIVGAVVKLTIPIVILLFLIAQYLAPPAQLLAESQRNAAISAGSPVSGDGFWAQKDSQFLSVAKILQGNIPADINIYAFAPDGSLLSSTHAERARIEPDGSWMLNGVTEETIGQAQFRLRHLTRLAWPAFVGPSEIKLLTRPTDAVSPLALFHYIGVLDQRHQQAIRYRQELWGIICIPVSMLAMIMIAAAFVFRPMRVQSAGQQIIIGGVLGIAFLFVQQIISYLVLLLDLDPAAATLAPSLILAAGALMPFHRLRRRLSVLL